MFRGLQKFTSTLEQKKRKWRALVTLCCGANRRHRRLPRSAGYSQRQWRYMTGTYSTLGTTARRTVRGCSQRALRGRQAANTQGQSEGTVESLARKRAGTRRRAGTKRLHPCCREVCTFLVLQSSNSHFQAGPIQPHGPGRSSRDAKLHERGHCIRLKIPSLVMVQSGAEVDALCLTHPRYTMVLFASQRGSSILAGMLADQEKEAWWEHYIAVKLDLVENVLKDDVGPEQGDEGQIRMPIAADDVTTPMPGPLLNLSCHFPGLLFLSVLSVLAENGRFALTLQEYSESSAYCKGPCSNACSNCLQAREETATGQREHPLAPLRLVCHIGEW